MQVQGRGAEVGIAEAIRKWNSAAQYGLPEVDYLIIARGGGSLEDLWCFNEEVLARAIAASRLPVVSAVGHETDFTIADFVADLRAPTPTAAIELTTPDAAALSDFLHHQEGRMRNCLTRAMQQARMRLRYAEQGPIGRPMLALARFAQSLDAMEEDLYDACEERFQAASSRLQVLVAKLSPRSLQLRLAAARSAVDSYHPRIAAAAAGRIAAARAAVEVHAANINAASPQNALDRGFALVRTPSGALARRAADLPPGSPLHITLSEGSVHATVTEHSAE